MYIYTLYIYMCVYIYIYIYMCVYIYIYIYIYIYSVYIYIYHQFGSKESYYSNLARMLYIYIYCHHFCLQLEPRPKRLIEGKRVACLIETNNSYNMVIF